MKSRLRIGAKLPAGAEVRVRAQVRVCTAYWLMPSVFDLALPGRPRPEALAGAAPCLEHALASLPSRRHLKAAVALLRKVPKPLPHPTPHHLQLGT